MVSTIMRSFLPITRLALESSCRPSVPLANKCLAANIWMGSYRIKNPQEYESRFPKPRRWPRKNEIVAPIQTNPEEDRRPATYHHYRENIKYSPKKMWYVTKFIRGMNVDEAIKQLRFMPYKGSQIAAEVLQEAQEAAVREHNFEFKSNMWVEDAITNKGLTIKGIKKHARMRFGKVCHFYCHLLVKLTEGDPPTHYYKPEKDGNDMLNDFYNNLRSRKIPQGL